MNPVNSRLDPDQCAIGIESTTGEAALFRVSFTFGAVNVPAVLRRAQGKIAKQVTAVFQPCGF